MSKHTKEPWAQSHRKAKHREGYYTEVYDSAGETIATLAWYPVEEPGGVTSTSRSANAARIVACVNALEGVEDPSRALDSAKMVLREVVVHLAADYSNVRRSVRDQDADLLRVRVEAALANLGGAR